MTTVVLDSSILLASVLVDEPLTTEAQRVLTEWSTANVELAAPRLFRSELIAVIRKAVFQKRITADHGDLLLDETLAYPVAFHDDNALLKRAYALATRFNLPRTYDAQYLALAKTLNCEFWTADKVLFNSIRSQFGHIRWLGHLVIP